jgi:23S rRNA (cytidine1920-2'-O)/16S rRNA (cytidine1409-2'-O)-methyltransferase
MTERTRLLRLDAVVTERGLAETRARAQAIILGGGITVDGVVTTKPGAPVPPDAVVALVLEPMPYVSRGGLKLEHALDSFDLAIEGRVAADVGASTGGFTDVLLKRGALRVYAIDVGYGQLAWTLRNDPRVVVMERTNIRHVESLPEEIRLGVVDVSFISLRTVLPALAPLMAEQADIVALIKPQFEAGRGQVGKKGVVRDPLVWRRVLDEVLSAAAVSGWSVAGLERSPILGPAGNVEFLAHLRRGAETLPVDVPASIRRVTTS